MSMELIDKDKIKYLSIPIAPVLVGENVHYEMGALKEWIDDMPTVEAIPLDRVEQIRAEIESKLQGVNTTLDVLVKDDALIPTMKTAKTTLEDVLEIIDKAIKEHGE